MTTPACLNPPDHDRLTRIEEALTEHPFPPQLVVENTSYCNLRCVHCCHKTMARPQRHMDRALWNRIVEEVGREAPDCELWPTFYGEALILGYRAELWDRLDYAAQVGCRNLVLNSNGTLLDRWDAYERILDSPLRRFILSLDGFTASTFEAIRVGARRDHVYACVEELLRRKAQRGQKYPTIVCQFSRMPLNVAEAEAFRTYWHERGADVKIRSLLEWTGTLRTGAGSRNAVVRIACPWGNNTMAIHQNGDVVACAVDYAGGFVVGNVRERSVKELWSALGVRLRRPHREHRWEDVPELCRRCHDWQIVGAELHEAVSFSSA